jgi:hypothetical protein
MLTMMLLSTALSIGPCLEPIESKPFECTTQVSVLIWSEDSEEVFRLTVPIDCFLADSLKIGEEIEDKYLRIPLLFEQSGKHRWHATIAMKDWGEVD